MLKKLFTRKVNKTTTHTTVFVQYIIDIVNDYQVIDKAFNSLADANNFLEYVSNTSEYVDGWLHY